MTEAIATVEELLEHIAQWAMEPEVTPGFTDESALFSTMRAYENVERILRDRLSAIIEAEKAEAYSLGQLAGLDDYERNDGTLTPNPYRAASTREGNRG